MFIQSRMIRLFTYICFIGLIGQLTAACAETDDPIDEGADQSAFSTEKGGDQAGPVLELPLTSAASFKCVQGVNGSYSHQGASTKYDLDFDTVNTADKAVFAAANGPAYVHGSAHDTDGFGLHINIDLGDGTYATTTHLKEVFIEDGDEVVAGQLIGVEGCSGWCQGDHVHVGRHRGDPQANASNGTSVPARYRIADASAGGGEKILSSGDFTCGIASAGDPEDGAFYTPALKDVATHPDGTLVKTPASPKVYRIEDGALHWIEDEDVFRSYRYDFSDVVTISQREFDCYGQGGAIREHGIIEAAYHQDTGELWLTIGTEDDALRYKVPDAGRQAVLHSWGIDPDRAQIPALPGDDGFFRHPPANAPVSFREGTLVKEYSSSDLYVVIDKVAVPIVDWSAYLKLGFLNREVMMVDDGVLERYLYLPGSCHQTETCIDFAFLNTCGGRVDTSGFSGPVNNNGSSDNGDMQAEEESEDSQNENIGSSALNVAYIPDGGLAVHSLTLFGRAYDGQDARVLQWRDLRTEDSENDLRWGTDAVDADDIALFGIRANDMDNWFLWCDQVKRHGTFMATFHGMPLNVEYTSTGDDGCRMEVRMPDAASGDVGGSQDDTSYDDQSSTDGDSSGQGSSGTSDGSSQTGDGGSGSGNSSGESTNDGSSGSSGQSGGGDEQQRRTLEVTWTTPLQQTAPRITLAGEYKLDNGNFGLTWRTLKQVGGQSSVTYRLDGVQSGDHLRFSAEYEDTAGNVSWSCIHDPGPPEEFIPQGTVQAFVDGQPVSAQTVGDPRPNVSGCGFRVTVP
jgi:hypothetical protein